ncbi:hypothetical protein SCP_1403520 [Sparassis crispa]|uniref:EF-hand domain-containing protein n=1 Tax=Sparassis crispa TaxID=139825 RepID=A0A401H3F6_9APHY|nr:hypothetical protein SCP_1403520 [Sparassis crispa]GBE88944.1 hypothetical protein SCP_1403520 [Sparassis crispa]
MALSNLFRIRGLKSFMGRERRKSALPAPLPLAASADTFPSSALPSSEIAAAHSTSPVSAALSDSTVPTILPWTPLDSPPQSMPEAVVFLSPGTSSPILQERGSGAHANRLHLNTTSDSSMSDVSVSTTDDDRVIGTLTVVSAQINKHGSSSKAEQALNALDDKVTTIQGQETLATTLYAPIKSAVALEAVSGIKKSIEDGINSFLDGMPVLMKALDEVAEIHPFVQVAVLAFKAVYTLETKRRANDKKIIALYVEMKDMIAVLIQLKTVKDEEDVGPDGVTLKGRLQGLVKNTADDMKDCANTCDAYSKMKLLAKVLKGPLWEGTLTNFGIIFTKRRTEFEFALSIHIGRGVDKANRKLDNLAQELKERADVLLQFMQSYVPLEQRELVALVQKKGGTKAVLDNENVLKELNSYESRRPTKTGDTQNQASLGHARTSKDDFEELKSDLRHDPAAAAINNFQTFEPKFAIQQRQLIEEVDRVVTRESDRVIQSVTSGTHDKVVDRDLYNVWKEMAWRGTVKARHFVLALRHYYHEKTDGGIRKESATKSVLTPDPDAWALEYLSVKRLHSIIDAFDEDASGFITVAEVNKLTAIRPLDWSLLHWIAYWAVGWRINATLYIRRINELLGKMFAIKEEVYATNGPYVDEYLHTVWAGVTSLTCSMRPMTSSDNLQARFKSRMDAEEERIRTNLEAVRYNINDMETLSLITGPGTIEKVRASSSTGAPDADVHDFEVVRLCRTKVVDRNELRDCADSLKWVFDTVQARYDELKDSKSSTSINNLRLSRKRSSNPQTSEFPTYLYKDEEEAQDIRHEDILNYPLDENYLYDCSAYEISDSEVETEGDRKAEAHLKALVGTWYVVVAQGDEYPSQSMFIFHVHVSADGRSIEGSGKTPEGTAYARYTTRVSTKCFRGHLDEEGTMLQGVWGYDSTDGSNDDFVMSRLAPEVLIYRPSPRQFAENRIEALWKFALSEVEARVRRQICSWSHFRQRRDIRKRYIQLLTRKWDFGRPLGGDEEDELTRCRKNLTPADARFYLTLYHCQLRTTPAHFGAACDNCGGVIGGTRTICIDCRTDRADRTVDICQDERCLSAEVKRSDLASPHLPSHAVYKVRRTVHDREFGPLDKEARVALQNARATFKHAVEVEKEQTEGAAKDDDRTAKLVNDTLKCIVCEKRVVRPCWLCMTCRDVYICLNCDPTDGITIGGHDKRHPLVRCPEEVAAEEPSTIERRIEALESKLDAVDGKIAEVDERLLRIQQLLQMMTMGAPTPSTAMSVSAEETK